MHKEQNTFRREKYSNFFSLQQLKNEQILLLEKVFININDIDEMLSHYILVYIS